MMRPARRSAVVSGRLAMAANVGTSALMVVSEPGDTLWSIAKRVAPGSDPRDIVDALVQARGTTALLPGETLTWLDD